MVLPHSLFFIIPGVPACARECSGLVCLSFRILQTCSKDRRLKMIGEHSRKFLWLMEGKIGCETWSVTDLCMLSSIVTLHIKVFCYKVRKSKNGLYHVLWGEPYLSWLSHNHLLSTIPPPSTCALCNVHPSVMHMFLDFSKPTDWCQIFNLPSQSAICWVTILKC